MTCPVALFAYKRPDHMRQVVDSLLENPEAADTELFIFCDAAKKADDQPLVDSVRAYAKLVRGFKQVAVIERERNLGLSRSITDGVGQLCRRYGRVAVVEDDVVVSSYFLGWVNAALEKYEHDDRVLSVGCYVFPTQSKLPETFFLPIPDCWGWAVWERSWRLYESDGQRLLDALSDRQLEARFDFEGNYPYTEMLRAQVEGKNDSWAVRWYASVLLNGGLTLYPGQSMTRNIGFDGSGVHCGVDDAYRSGLAERRVEIEEIPVAESVIGRCVWRDFLKSTQQSRTVGALVRRIRAGLRRRFA